MSPPQHEDSRRKALVLWGALTATLTIACQVAAKATRDALFLSTYSAEALPAMMIASAALTLVLILPIGRLMVRMTPGRLVPTGFALSAVGLFAEWILARTHPGLASILLYLHLAVVGAALISGFWSLINERLSPRQLRRSIGRLTAGATFGGLLGGILADQAAQRMAPADAFALLAVIHLGCAAGAWRMARLWPTAAASKDGAPASLFSGLRALRAAGYLRDLALLILLLSSMTAVVDFLFKVEAAKALGDGPALMQFFARFYAVVGLLTFFIQVTLGAFILERLGLARATAMQPVAVCVGLFGAMLAPGLWLIAAIKGLDEILHNAMFRSGYEAMYAPIPPAKKHAAKPLIDVGVSRVAHILGSALIAAVLWLAPTFSTHLLIAIAGAFAVAALFVSLRLQQGYLQALTHGLRERTLALDPSADDEDIVDDDPDDALMRTLSPDGEVARAPSRPLRSRRISQATIEGTDPQIALILELRSRDTDRARAAIAHLDRLGALGVAVAVQQLSRDDLAADLLRALRARVERHVGALTDTLIDPTTPFSIRRRLPRILAASKSTRAVRGLLAGLRDPRFEVRFHCGAALASVRARQPNLKLQESLILATLEREARPEGFPDNASTHPRATFLEHIVTLLSLIHDPEPLRLIQNALESDDPGLLDLALEYLESLLSPTLWGLLAPTLEAQPRAPRASIRPREEILGSIRTSSQISAQTIEAARRMNEEG